MVNSYDQFGADATLDHLAVVDIWWDWHNQRLAVRVSYRLKSNQMLLFFASLACATACDGWKNVDYVTEMAKFFSYWTFMPFIIMTYAGISTIDGVLGICGTVLEHKPTMKATMIIGVIYLILAFVLLIFFSVVSCLYWVCRCCIEKTVDEAKVS